MLQLLHINHVLKFDAAIIQGQPLFEGGTITLTHLGCSYTIQYIMSIKLKTSEVSHACWPRYV